MSKKDAAIYRKAAELIYTEKERYACEAISEAESGFWGNTQSPCRVKFRDAYGKRDGNADGWYGTAYGELGEIHQHQRIVALCFAAAMAETGDL